jgi:hypothetical protein
VWPQGAGFARLLRCRIVWSHGVGVGWSCSMGQDIWSCPRAHAAAFGRVPLGIRGHGAGLSRPRCEPRTDRSHFVSVRAAAHTKPVLQCAEGQNRTRTRPRLCQRVLAPPDCTPPVVGPWGAGFDDFWQMSGVIGSSPADSCGHRSSRLASTDEVDRAHVPRICRPPQSRCSLYFRWLRRLAGHD